LQDIGIDPAWRSEGLGRRLVAFVEAQAAARGCEWLFLESGIRNRRAHRFFEDAGFEAVSHTFAKPLRPHPA
jgi:ribosomal protein S18 acetylase RimI-like enzyme